MECPHTFTMPKVRTSTKSAGQNGLHFIPINEFFGFAGKRPSCEEKEKIRKIVKSHVVFIAAVGGQNSCSDLTCSPYPNQLVDCITRGSPAVLNSVPAAFLDPHSVEISSPDSLTVGNGSVEAVPESSDLDLTKATQPKQIVVADNSHHPSLADEEDVIDASCYDSEGYVLPFGSCLLSTNDGKRKKLHTQLPDGRFAEVALSRKSKPPWMCKFENDFKSVMFGEINSSKPAPKKSPNVRAFWDHTYAKKRETVHLATNPIIGEATQSNGAPSGDKLLSDGTATSENVTIPSHAPEAPACPADVPPQKIINTALDSYPVIHGQRFPRLAAVLSTGPATSCSEDLGSTSAMEKARDKLVRKSSRRISRNRKPSMDDDGDYADCDDSGETQRRLRQKPYPLRQQPRKVKYNEEEGDSEEEIVDSKKKKSSGSARKGRNSMGSDSLSTGDESVELRPAVVDADGEEKWWVEKILDRRINASGDVEYLVKWLGYSLDDNSWEPASGCECQTLIDIYNRLHGFED